MMHGQKTSSTFRFFSTCLSF